MTTTRSRTWGKVIKMLMVSVVGLYLETQMAGNANAGANTKCTNDYQICIKTCDKGTVDCSANNMGCTPGGRERWIKAHQGSDPTINRRVEVSRGAEWDRYCACIQDNEAKIRAAKTCTDTCMNESNYCQREANQSSKNKSE